MREFEVVSAGRHNGDGQASGWNSQVTSAVTRERNSCVGRGRARSRVDGAEGESGATGGGGSGRRKFRKRREEQERELVMGSGRCE